MLTTQSRDGVYTISAPDNAKVGCFLLSNGESEETKYDKVQDVYLEVVENEEANLYNLASAICYDCFDFDGLGLHLLAKMLKCHVKSGEKKYEFTITHSNNINAYISEIAFQTKI